jgi:hypothetical protein
MKKIKSIAVIPNQKRYGGYLQQEMRDGIKLMLNRMPERKLNYDELHRHLISHGIATCRNYGIGTYELVVRLMCQDGKIVHNKSDNVVALPQQEQ